MYYCASGENSPDLLNNYNLKQNIGRYQVPKEKSEINPQPSGQKVTLILKKKPFFNLMSTFQRGPGHQPQYRAACLGGVAYFVTRL